MSDVRFFPSRSMLGSLEVQEGTPCLYLVTVHYYSTMFLGAFSSHQKAQRRVVDDMVEMLVIDPCRSKGVLRAEHALNIWPEWPEGMTEQIIECGNHTYMIIRVPGADIPTRIGMNEWVGPE